MVIWKFVWRKRLAGLLLGLVLGLVLSIALSSVAQPSVATEKSSKIAAWSVQAQLANQAGIDHWRQGNLEQALASWQTATAAYAQDLQGLLGSSVNQAMALRSLGFLRDAETVLVRLEQQLSTLADPHIQAKGLRQLAITRRQLGQLARSEADLRASLELGLDPNANALEPSDPDPSEPGLSWLELGNTHRAQARQASNLGQWAEAQTRVGQAIAAYQQAAQRLPPALGLTAQLNELGLWREAGRADRALALLPTVRSGVEQLPGDRPGIYARLNLAQQLLCFYSNTSPGNTSPGCRHINWESPTSAQNMGGKAVADMGTRPSLAEIRQLTRQTLMLAQQQGAPLELGGANRRSESHALGQLGALYEITQQGAEAQQLTQRAILALEGLRAPEMLYCWEWQQARLFAQQQQFPAAIAAYRRSVEALQRARADLVTINPEVQFSLRDNVEPVYRELIDLLLRQVAAAELSPADNSADNSVDIQANLQEAIDQANALKLAEIENFLGCTLSYSLKVNQALDRLDPTAAFLYPIVLGDRIEVIFKLPGQPLQHRATRVPQAEVESSLAELRRSLLGRDSGKVIQRASQVYDWLIRPVESSFMVAEKQEKPSEKSPEKSSKTSLKKPSKPSLETLVFVLDGSLRDVPMSALYDAQTGQYLAEKSYSIALLPSADLFDLRQTERRRSVLGAGVSEARTIANRQFDALNTDQELDAIQSIVAGRSLLNQQFTLLGLKQLLDQIPFSVLHLATHGKFSSNPEETYVLAYDALLQPRDLELLLQATQDNPQALELLVLSACETAVGDRRATLGLAGLAVRSGAKSTLATLWQVSDDSTVALMEQFYRELGKPGISKAEALHRAQQQLLQQPEYQNPFYWAPYVLVGNWR